MANKKGQNKFQKKKQEGIEKRAVPRIKREVTVQYRIKETPSIRGVQIALGPYADISQTKDLSEKGVFFTASRDIPSQTILEIKLRLPTQEELVGLEGRVVGCEEIKEKIIYGIRVEFANLRDEQKEALRNFVQLFLKDEGR